MKIKVTINYKIFYIFEKDKLEEFKIMDHMYLEVLKLILKQSFNVIRNII